MDFSMVRHCLREARYISKRDRPVASCTDTWQIRTLPLDVEVAAMVGVVLGLVGRRGSEQIMARGRRHGRGLSSPRESLTSGRRHERSRGCLGVASNVGKALPKGSTFAR